MSATPSAATYARSNVGELEAVVSAVSAEELDRLVSAILAAERVYFTGLGRSGLMAKAIAMRLMHIGLASFAVGEIATPGVAEGDLLVAFTARGGQAVIAQARKAHSVGASVAAVTVDPDPELAQLATAVVTLPIRTEIPTQQHAGSLFEQSCLVICDAVCRTVQETLGVPTSELNRRHASLP